ncbi:MAG: DUF4405 domain-containing protein [Kiritimatiellae bacterium]|nr:DUF4405 domain-containing protein [Kiritimatiellia bacterium]MDW8458947.1 DUF4405 domain-containing protein [Verrucomicrobiota bacterium]
MKLANKLTWNRIVDFLLWLSISLMAATGFILRYRLPPGSRGGRGLEIWGLSRHEWGDLHAWLAYVAIALVLLHLALHWKWLWYTAWPGLKWPVLVGLLAGLLLVLAVWILPVEHRGFAEERGYQGGEGRDVSDPRSSQRSYSIP